MKSFNPLLIIPVFIILSTTLNLNHLAISGEGEAPPWEDANRKIISYLEQGRCTEAEKLMTGVRELDKQAPYLPDWYEGLLRCGVEGSFDSYANRSYIHEYYMRSLWATVKAADCRLAEKILGSALGRPGVKNNHLLFYVGRSCEKHEKEKSLLRYREVMKMFAGHDAGYSDERDYYNFVRTQFRINWLTLEHTWVFSDPMELMDQVADALRSRNSTRLMELASKSNFYVGEIDADFNPSLLPGKFEMIFKDDSPKISEPVLENGRYRMKTEGWTNYSSIQIFQFEKDQFGWQWTGLIAAGDPTFPGYPSINKAKSSAPMVSPVFWIGIVVFFCGIIIFLIWVLRG